MDIEVTKVAGMISLSSQCKYSPTNVLLRPLSENEYLLVSDINPGLSSPENLLITIERCSK